MATTSKPTIVVDEKESAFDDDKNGDPAGVSTRTPYRRVTTYNKRSTLRTTVTPLSDIAADWRSHSSGR